MSAGAPCKILARRPQRLSCKLRLDLSSVLGQRLRDSPLHLAWAEGLERAGTAQIGPASLCLQAGALQVTMRLCWPYAGRRTERTESSGHPPLEGLGREARYLGANGAPHTPDLSPVLPSPPARRELIVSMQRRACCSPNLCDATQAADYDVNLSESQCSLRPPALTLGAALGHPSLMAAALAPACARSA